MNRPARLGREVGEFINELLMPVLLPVMAAYFAVRGLPWLIGEIAK